MADEQQTSTVGDRIWAAAEGYLKAAGNDPPERDTLAAAVAEAAAVMGEPATDVYIAKLTEGGFHNQVWQGRGITAPSDVMVFVDQSGNIEGVLDELKGRLNPPPGNGFAVAVIAKPQDGESEEWQVHKVVEYEQSTVGARIRDILGSPELGLISVPDPDLTAALTPSTPSTTATGDLTLSELAIHLAEAKNVVLEGPPGTGKTRMAFEMVSALTSQSPDDCRLEQILGGNDISECEPALKAAELVWEFVQFHPAYSYEDFVRGLRTDQDASGFALKVVDGVLPQMCRVAEIREAKPTLLIIDELNRANLSSVLGETVFAIDPSHRGQEVRLQHSGQGADHDALRVPPNLMLLATMNTADRSIALIDFAIRRRFRFLGLRPSADVVDGFYSSNPERAKRAVELFELLTGAIDEPDLKPGHSYFLVRASGPVSQEEWAKLLAAQVVDEVRPLLREYSAEGLPVGNPLIDIDGKSVSLLLDREKSVTEALEKWLVVGL